MNMIILSFLAPLIGFLILSFGNRRLSENTVATVAIGAMAASFASVVVTGMSFLAHPAGYSVYAPLWTWVNVPGLQIDLSLYLDGLAYTMLGVITGVGLLIHVFASWYMRGEDGYSRFFSYMNLFVASMVVLVTGSSLVTLYMGWEGVGLCSYLLIGFYYKVTANGQAAQKAFIVTRIGDVFLALGLFLLHEQLGTLDIQQLAQLAPQHFAVGAGVMNVATLLLLGGAVGKSAQMPLQTWLADAMAGPTPVSALIHAATMVTAGVYLIARTHVLFQLAPDTLELVGIIGAATLLMSGFAALAQKDIKRVLAFSTMSQIGYMFLALGVGAWSAAIFHLMAHAFFKALLFLGSGAVIIACHHEQNIFRMGGLWRKIPFVYACFLVGGGALAALPWITVGFYSKDEILWQAVAQNHMGLFYCGLLGAFLTSVYTFRMIFIVFHGEEHGHAHAIHGVTYWLPLGILMVLSTFIGAGIHPPLQGVLPEAGLLNLHAGKEQIELLSVAVGLTGLGIAAALFLGNRKLIAKVAESAIGKRIALLWLNAWGFDWLYRMIFIKTYLAMTWILRKDPGDQLINTLPALSVWANKGLSATQNGKMKVNTTVMATGVVVLVMIVFVLMH